MVTPEYSPTPSARRIAKAIINGFEAYFADFQNITLGAKARFETADWSGVHEASRERIDLYKSKVQQVATLIPGVTSKDIRHLALWREVKQAYAQLVSNHGNFEIAETFYNSVFCKLFQHATINDEHMFVFSSRSQRPPATHYSIFISYSSDLGLRPTVARIFDDFAFSVPWEDAERDIDNIARVVEERVLPQIQGRQGQLRVEMLESVFYRNKGAYLVGRVVNGWQIIPVVLPLMNNENGGVFIDTVIFDPDDVSIIFSFTRSYFMVEAALPYQYVHFLKTLMPHKEYSELYNALGYNKHGKTEFYRSFMRHLQRSEDQFEIAPGIKGMVMTVFTLPSYDIVFKVIKDKFDPPKEVTHEIVREKYRLVSRHDRAGRMADTHEFKNFRLPRARFSEALLNELRAVAPSVIEEEDDTIVVRHLYTERRMTPLNLYLQHATDEQIEAVMDEYGNAIKQLAAANIFPGDMLLKNFGVTRHGRVVFYDYDEICLLTECHFRAIPEPRTEEEAFADRPWYTVGPDDIFPEEFRLFFSGNPKARAAFEALHSDIYDADFWRGMQQAIEQGKVVDMFPYRRKQRFAREPQ